MSAQFTSSKKQVKALAKNLKKGIDVNESLATLCQLDAPMKYFERYDVEVLARKFVEIQEHAENASKLESLLKQRKCIEIKVNSSAGVEKENRKRPSSLPIEASSVKRGAPMGWEMFPTVISNKEKSTMPNIEMNIEPKPVGTKKAVLLPVDNSKLSSNIPAFVCDEAMIRKRTDSTQMFGKRRSNEENFGRTSKLCRPAQILRKLNGVSIDEIKLVLLQCSSNQKLRFIKLNMNFAAETESVFEEMTKSDFKDIDDLPSEYQHWFEYYEQLLEWKNNNEAMKLEEVRLMIAQKKAKQLENKRTTKVIEVQAQSQYRSSGGSIRRPVPLVEPMPIARKAGKSNK